MAQNTQDGTYRDARRPTRQFWDINLCRVSFSWSFMDASLHNAVAAAAADAAGVLVADTHGLCVASAGAAPPAAAAYAVAVLQRAASLHSAASGDANKANNVVVRIEAEDLCVCFVVRHAAAALFSS